MTDLSNIVRWEGDPKVVRSGPSSLTWADRLARALGWFSIGLGVVQLVAPRAVTRHLGVEGKERLVQVCGARELGTGMLTLSTEKHVGLGARVAGDLVDLAAVVAMARSPGARQEAAGRAIVALAGITLLDMIAVQSVAATHRRGGRPVPRYRDRSGFPQGVEKARVIAQAAAAE